IAKDKIIIGLPFYGYEWIDNQFSWKRGHTYNDAMNKLPKSAGGLMRDQYFTPHFEFQDKDGTHNIWFEDNASLAKKLDVILNHGVRGVSIWRLGEEDSRNYKSFRYMLNGYRTPEINILKVEMLDVSNKPKTNFTSGDTVKIIVSINNNESLAEIIASLNIRDKSHNIIYDSHQSSPAEDIRTTIEHGEKKDLVFQWKIPEDALKGEYDIVVGIHSEDYTIEYASTEGPEPIRDELKALSRYKKGIIISDRK
ncbi:MAG: Wzt carbohydrate-binding domain-containing protein, partial [bacterium]